MVILMVRKNNNKASVIMYHHFSTEEKDHPKDILELKLFFSKILHKK